MKIYPFDLWSSRPAEHEHDLARLLLSGQHAEASDAAKSLSEAALSPGIAQLMLLAHCWAGLPSRVESLVRTLEHPLRTEVRICLAYCYYTLCRFELALETLSESDRSQYAMPAYWEVYGLVNMGLGRWEQCERALERLEAVGSLGEAGHLNISCWWNYSGENFETFLALANEYLELRPSDLLMQTEQRFISVVKFGEAPIVLESLIDEYPHYDYAWYRVAHRKSQQGSLDEALEAARRATKSGPYQFRSWQLLAQLAYEKKRWPEAYAAAEVAVNLAGQYGLKYIDLVDHVKCQKAGFRSLVRQFRIVTALKFLINSVKEEHSQVGSQGVKEFNEYRRSMRGFLKAHRTEKPTP